MISNRITDWSFFRHHDFQQNYRLIFLSYVENQTQSPVIDKVAYVNVVFWNIFFNILK
jgi:hypothetical protein